MNSKEWKLTPRVIRGIGTVNIGFYKHTASKYLEVKTNNYDKEAMASTKQYWRERYNNKDFPFNVRNTMK